MILGASLEQHLIIVSWDLLPGLLTIEHWLDLFMDVHIIACVNSCSLQPMSRE